MNSDDLEAFADLNGRLGAIETLLCETLTFQYLKAGISAARAEDLIRQQDEHLSMQAAFRTDDPGLSDIVNAARQDHVRRLSSQVSDRLRKIESLRS